MPRFHVIVAVACVAVPIWSCGAPASIGAARPQLEQIAVWIRDMGKATAFSQDTLGWNRHPVRFGFNDDAQQFGGVKLAFVDANGLWLELIEPTTPGPGMDLLRNKGNGFLGELDFSVRDFDKHVEDMRAKGIELVGTDGKPLRDGGQFSEWVIRDGHREVSDERLAFLPPEVSRGTAIEFYWEYPNGVVLYRDAMSKRRRVDSINAPRLTYAVVLAADLERTTKLFIDTLELKRGAERLAVRRDWMGVGDESHSWIDSNERGFAIEVVTPPSSEDGIALIKNSKYGDGAIVELAAEVNDIDVFYDQMKAKGITLTTGDQRALPVGEKAVTMKASGDRYAYLPLSKSEGMRIVIYQSRKSAPSN